MKTAIIISTVVSCLTFLVSSIVFWKAYIEDRRGNYDSPVLFSISLVTGCTAIGMMLVMAVMAIWLGPWR